MRGRQKFTGQTLLAIGLVILFAGASDAQEAASAAQEAEQTAAKSESEARATPGGDAAAIRDQAREFVDAFNEHDSEAIASMWTENGEYVDESGQTFTGREAIAQCYAELFSEKSDVKIRVLVDSVRVLTDNAAIEDGRAVLEPAPAGAPGYSTYTAVHVKRGGQWLMASVRDAWVEKPSTHSHVADLEWLIGNWVAEDHGARTESTCRWIAEKNFVERRYTTTGIDGMQTSGVQLIGWNPAGGHVQSWNFSPDGGHAIGVWTPRKGGWSAEMHGVAGDGAVTASVNLLTQLDDQAYVWQSISRRYNDQSLPDTDEVVLRRRSAPR